MSLKRTFDDVVPDYTASYFNNLFGEMTDNLTASRYPANTDTAQGKQRRLSFFDTNGDCATASTSARPRALPSTSSTARFVPGLQTFVGGLHMSQDSLLPRSDDAPPRSSSATAARRSFDAPEVMQPLMMSRNADTERRASQAMARRQSQAALEAPPNRASLVSLDAQLVPGVSPGWHVEAHGRQAMELQDGIRFQDEEGWTPLEAFPALTRQGKLAVKRAKIRRKQHRHQFENQRQSQWETLVEPDTIAELRQSPALAPTDLVKPTLETRPSGRTAATPAPAFVDIVMIEDIVDTLSVPLLGACASHVSRPTLMPSLASRSGPPAASSSDPKTSSSSTEKVAKSVGSASPLRSSPNRPYALSDFEVVETLGTGTFGRVLLVRLKDRDVADRSAYFALKVLAKTDVIKLKQVSHINSERCILTKVDHPFLVNMIASFQDSKNCYMLMEYVVGGEIFSYLRRAGHFSADVARFYISTIVLAIEYLHSNKVVYRDLKPENLLIDSNGYTKITDFGFAKEVEDRTWTLCGTPEYLAPEIIQCSGHGSAVDWWSLGILLFEMLAGYPPFYDPNPILIYEKILAGNLVFPEEIDPLSRDLISSLLTADRSRRLGNLRGGANDVKNHPWFHGVDWKALQEGRILPPIVPYLGRPGDTSNFSKYEPARPSAMPGLYGADSGHHDLYADLFPDF
ncbi:cAMP-dependent protein kinase catalytic subunit [Mycosarcoma maydis]|uniref:cAMP-dependent protein kinase n=3 Tax=Mycosarcoma maydis TaxID=5270 RepID=A0A0D1E5D9_MYCMD|nr:cAMP-dependent protein kinase catalytic subunit [Ustilago maydis 521]KIS71219.1 cAMP-dependent protein kinase catalytic subunit [Ustilago maydis 521]|eukprot:XP_011387469.1 cAMP-dependent protein kinase catalytic subunit [Ustilago maydis 521]